MLHCHQERSYSENLSSLASREVVEISIARFEPEGYRDTKASLEKRGKNALQ